VHGIEDVQARLWQDPFGAASRQIDTQKKKIGELEISLQAPISGANPTSALMLQTAMVNGKPSTDSDRHALKKLVENIKKEAAEDEQNKITVLAAMVSAGPYAKQTETRLRTRYAILSALGAEKYYPKDAEHIGYVSDLNKSLTAANALRAKSNGAESNHAKQDTARNHDKADQTLPSRSEQLPIIMPYEWYELKEKGEKHILLLWLDEDAFAHKPLTKLNDLFGLLGSDVSSIKLIGPYGSGTLKAMFEEAGHSNLDTDALKKVDVYSATATADENELTEGQGKVASAFKENSIFKSFQRTIDSDGKLMSLIVDELAARIHVATFAEETIQNIFGNDSKANIKKISDPSERKKIAGSGFSEGVRKTLVALENNEKIIGYHTAIVSEWDTVYGRALPRAYALAVCKRVSANRGQTLRVIKSRILDQKQSVADMKSYINNLMQQGKLGNGKALTGFLERRNHDYEGILSDIRKALDSNQSSCTQDKLDDFAKSFMHHFTYMRGIDGGLASQSHSERKIEEASDKLSNQGVKRVVERPEGHSQKDYLRRLAGQISDMDRQLKLKGGKGIRAIGVLGSDVYDKLLIFRVLRERFPKAVFFTTDLDAALVHPSQFCWTRNIVVASAFGLGLTNEQQNTPKFRDSYQTSEFISTRLALGATRHSNAPSIYEVGRSGAFRLNAIQSDAGKSAEDFLHVIKRNEINLKTISKYLLVLMLMVLLALLFWRTRVRQQKRVKGSQGWKVGLLRWTTLALKMYVGFLVAQLIYLIWVPDAALQGIPVGNDILLNTITSLLAIFVSIALYIYFYLLVWRRQRPWRALSTNLLRRKFRRFREADSKLLGIKKSVYAAALFIQAICGFLFRPLAYAKPVHFAAFLLIAFCSDLYDGRAEPINFTEGISIWPTEFIRLVAVWLSFFLIWHSWAKIKKNHAEISSVLNCKHRLHDEPAVQHDIRDIWLWYREQGSCWQRIKRISLPAVIWLTICVTIFGIQSPNIPFRGLDAYWTDLGVSFLAHLPPSILQIPYNPASYG